MKRSLLTVALALTASLAAPALADDGAAVFDKKCATCHGKDGKAATPMGKKLQIRDLATAEIQAKSDADLLAWVTAGNMQKKMPAFKDKLTAEEIKGAVQHVRSFKK